MRARTAAFVVAAVLAGTTVTLAQSGTQTQSGYRLPPKAVVDIVDAAPLPTVEVSPAGDVLAILPRRSQLSIAEMSQPMLRLAGMRINPANNGPHRAPMTTGITLRSIATGVERAVQRLTETDVKDLEDGRDSEHDPRENHQPGPYPAQPGRQCQHQREERERLERQPRERLEGEWHERVAVDLLGDDLDRDVEREQHQ